MDKVQENNINVAIADGLAQEITQQLKHDVEVFGPVEGGDMVHGILIGMLDDKTLYRVVVKDGKVKVEITGGIPLLNAMNKKQLAALLAADRGGSRRPQTFREEETTKEYEVDVPTLVDDIISFIRRHTVRCPE